MFLSNLVKIFFFAAIICIGLMGCEEDCPPDDNCNPTYHYLSANELSFYNFILQNQSDTIKYYKTNNSIYLFDRTPILLDTSGNCSNQYEYYSAAYLTSINISRIDYIINPYIEDHLPRNFIIMIGTSSCQSFFKINTTNDTSNLDSIQLLDKTFYDVYHRTTEFGGCASAMYYNKQYGIVGFNWQGEWYVLETDSL